MKEIIITKNDENQRLDKLLMKYLNNAPKSFIYKMLRKKNIKLNGAKALGGEMLANGDVVSVYFSDETIEKFSSEKAINKSAGGIDIIYEDDKIIAVNKPAGVLSHPESQEDNDTLIDRILNYLAEKNEFDVSARSIFTPALANRLDRNTTGLVICGKTLEVIQWLNANIKNRKIEKNYRTIVSGKFNEEKTLIAYHAKTEGNKALISFEKPETEKLYEFKEIITKFRPISYKDGFTYCEVTLVTGKSHQIRAVLQKMGHPIVGDIKYGGSKVFGLKKQLLHAYSLEFTEAEGTFGYLHGKVLKAPLPARFQNILKQLGCD